MTVCVAETFLQFWVSEVRGSIVSLMKFLRVLLSEQPFLSQELTQARLSLGMRLYSSGMFNWILLFITGSDESYKSRWRSQMGNEKLSPTCISSQQSSLVSMEKLFFSKPYFEISKVLWNSKKTDYKQDVLLRHWHDCPKPTFVFFCLLLRC